VNLHQIIGLLSGECSASGVSHLVKEICFAQSVEIDAYNCTFKQQLLMRQLLRRVTREAAEQRMAWC
jgi:hypothetical protein